LQQKAWPVECVGYHCAVFATLAMAPAYTLGGHCSPVTREKAADARDEAARFVRARQPGALKVVRHLRAMHKPTYLPHMNIKWIRQRTSCPALAAERANAEKFSRQ
jgi:hypothetical protein